MKTTDFITEQTERERQRLIAAGTEQWTKRRLLESLDALGYKVDPTASFNYNNMGNEIPYKARHIYIVEKKNGLSFANINAERPNYEQLKEIRRNVFCFENGRIWEL